MKKVTASRAAAAKEIKVDAVLVAVARRAKNGTEGFVKTFLPPRCLLTDFGQSLNVTAHRGLPHGGDECLTSPRNASSCSNLVHLAVINLTGLL